MHHSNPNPDAEGGGSSGGPGGFAGQGFPGIVKSYAKHNRNHNLSQAPLCQEVVKDSTVKVVSTLKTLNKLKRYLEICLERMEVSQVAVVDFLGGGSRVEVNIGPGPC